jgi:uncharacterized protein with PhoU and TrkA domain
MEELDRQRDVVEEILKKGPQTRQTLKDDAWAALEKGDYEIADGYLRVVHDMDELSNRQ